MTTVASDNSLLGHLKFPVRIAWEKTCDHENGLFAGHCGKWAGKVAVQYAEIPYNFPCYWEFMCRDRFAADCVHRHHISHRVQRDNLFGSICRCQIKNDQEKAVNMLDWLHSLLPHVPHYGYVLVFIVVFLNNIGVPLPGETILLGAGFILGRAAGSLWQPIAAGTVACFLGGICAFWLGRRLGHSGLEKIHWLHLTPERVKWPERFFKRHGAKAVFIARFIALFPPIAANLLAGTAKMPWRIFLFYNLTGSAVYTSSYILIGFVFGKKWKLLEAWLGPTVLYLILAGIVLIVLGVIFGHSLSRFLVRLFSKKRKRK